MRIVTRITAAEVCHKHIRRFHAPEQFHFLFLGSSIDQGHGRKKKSRRLVSTHKLRYLNTTHTLDQPISA